MNEPEPTYVTTPIEPADAAVGFSCGHRALDDFFARHAVRNDALGVGRAYVLRRGAAHDDTLPAVLGFYTLSMASAASSQVAKALDEQLPKYPMPVALIGRLAVDERARRRRLGETLLIDALRRAVDASALVGCVGIVVDAKDEGAAAFYAKYDFVTLDDGGWPRRMFLAIGTARAAFEQASP